MRRPTFAMDHYIMNMKSVVNAQIVSEEAATCIAVKEDRHQNIIRSVALENRESKNRGHLKEWRNSLTRLDNVRPR